MRWVQNFQEYGRVESAQALERPAASPDQEKIVSIYFIRYQSRLSRREEQYITISKSSVDNYFAKCFKCFPTNFKSFTNLQTMTTEFELGLQTDTLHNIQDDVLFVDSVPHF